MYAEPGKGAIHGAKDLRHGDVYLRLGLIPGLIERGIYFLVSPEAAQIEVSEQDWPKDQTDYRLEMKRRFTSVPAR